MAYGTSSSENRALSHEEKILNVFRMRKDHGVQVCSPLYSRLGDYYNMFRGLYGQVSSPFRNFLHLPFAFSIVLTDVARKAQAIFGGDLPIEFQGYSFDDAKSAHRNTRLVNAQLEDSNSMVKSVKFLTSADLYGTAVARVGWKYLARMEKFRVNREVAPGLEVEEWVTDEVERFNGPDWEVLNLHDFIPQPGVDNIEDMRYCFHRYFLTLDDMYRLAKRGVFDRAKVDEVKARADDRTSAAYGQWLSIRSPIDQNAAHQDKVQPPIEVYDMVGEVPEECAIDGVSWLIVTVADDKTVLRIRPFPFNYGKLPFVHYSPVVDPHSFFGIGKIEPIYRLQAISNKLASMSADASELGIEPMWLVNLLAGVDMNGIVTRAGKVVGIQGPVTDEMIRSFSPDMKGVQLSSALISQYWQYAQQATGIIEDTVQGGPPASSRQTLGEFRGRQENVLNRLGLETVIASKRVAEPLGNWYRGLNKQFLSVPHMVKILGTSASIDPDTGLPIPAEPTVIDLNDINADYRAKAVGAVQMLGRSAKQSNAAFLLQACSANPVAVNILNWVSFFRYIFRTFDLPNVDDFIVNQIPGVNMLADQAGMSAGAMGGAADSMTGGGQIPPELAAVLGGGQ